MAALANRVPRVGGLDPSWVCSAPPSLVVAPSSMSSSLIWRLQLGHPVFLLPPSLPPLTAAEARDNLTGRAQTRTPLDVGKASRCCLQGAGPSVFPVGTCVCVCVCVCVLTTSLPSCCLRTPGQPSPGNPPHCPALPPGDSVVEFAQ